MTGRPGVRGREFGGPLHQFLRWTYARWIQVLAHGDLLGADGKPSQGKLAALTVMVIGAVMGSEILVLMSLFAAFGRSTLLEGIRSWRGTSASTRERRDVNVTVRTAAAIAAARDPLDGTEPAGKVPQVFHD